MEEGTQVPKQEVAKKEEKKEEKKTWKSKCFYITAAIKFWCLVTLIVLWYFTIKALGKEDFQKHVIAWYLLAISIIMTVLESIWVIKHMPCCGETGCCYSKCWKITVTVSRWKGILYVVLALPTYWIEKNHVDSIVGGTMLLISGILLITLSVFHLCYNPNKKSAQKYFLKTKSPRVKLVAQEVSTQTDDDAYYSKLYQDQDKPDTTQVP